jgi:hypothetical protein
MVHAWLVERMADEHRRDLSLLGRAAPQIRREGDPFAAAAAVDRLPGVEQGSYAGAPGERRPIGQHVGTLLIRVGTRLGGASIRTS